MIYYTVIAKEDKDQGIMGVDEIGRIHYVGLKALITPLQTFFRDHKDFKVVMREGDQLVLKTIETKNQLAWIKELRRQIPAPYFGKAILEMVGTLDTLSTEWEKLNGKEYDIARFN